MPDSHFMAVLAELPELSEDEKNFEPLDVEDNPSEAELARQNRVLPPPEPDED